MTPQPSRRPSYSRRSQYGAFAAYVIAVTGGLAGLGAALLWAVDPTGFAELRMAIYTAMSPASRAIGSGLSAISEVDDEVGAYWRAGSQNARLNRELTAARRELIVSRALQAENAQLRALLRLDRAEAAPVATARLLMSSATSTRRFAILDAGRAHGVEVGQPVRSASGLIGRTLQVGSNASRIILLTDPQNVVPVRRASDGLAALSTGRGDSLVEVRSLNSASNNFRIGDVFLTSGSGGLYHARTPVAVIVRLTNDGGLARPIADPSTTDAVVVQRAANAGIDLPPEPEAPGAASAE